MKCDKRQNLKGAALATCYVLFLCCRSFSQLENSNFYEDNSTKTTTKDSAKFVLLLDQYLKLGGHDALRALFLVEKEAFC